MNSNNNILVATLNYGNHMTYDIEASLSETTIAPKQALITYLIYQAKKKKLNDVYQEAIFEFLSEKEKIPFLGNYCLIGPKHALGCFIGHFLYNYLEEKDFNKQIDLLKSLSNDLDKLQPSPNKLLNKTVAAKLIGIIHDFGLPGHFLRGYNFRPLRVYFIPYRHVKLNAGYLPYLNSIVSYRPKEKGSNPEYIFVHEIGHLLIYNLTDDPEKVPDSFIEFNKKYNPSWKGDLIEVFVDLFSMAVMMDTEFAAKNPFLKKYSLKMQKIVRDYFISLMDEVKNKNVKSWLEGFDGIQL